MIPAGLMEAICGSSLEILGYFLRHPKHLEGTQKPTTRESRGRHFQFLNFCSVMALRDDALENDGRKNTSGGGTQVLSG